MSFQADAASFFSVEIRAGPDEPGNPGAQAVQMSHRKCLTPVQIGQDTILPCQLARKVGMEFSKG